jgi:hypothetical protein
MSQSNFGYPSQKLISEWADQVPHVDHIVKQAADWQLDRCCEEVSFFTSALAAKALRERCRPKPDLPTKQEARDLLDAGIYYNLTMHEKQEAYNKLRALIDSLPDD